MGTVHSVVIVGIFFLIKEVLLEREEGRSCQDEISFNPKIQ